MSSQTQHDEYYANSEGVRSFIATVQAMSSATEEPATLLDQLKPAFGQLLADDNWLPAEFAEPYLASGMGGGIGQYLLYRSADKSLTLFSLVVPAGSSTPVHDHLAWGLVGLYRGEQHEEVYALERGHPDDGNAGLRLVEERDLHTGEFYALLPPDGDIHRVTTISPEASISIHLLGNDAGCVVRHRYEPELNQSASFRSGYSNVACVDEAMA
jgi:predicted metal-dependent enzyme (double-stranded beta helix superfamily)